MTDLRRLLREAGEIHKELAFAQCAREELGWIARYLGLDDGCTPGEVREAFVRRLETRDDKTCAHDRVSWNGLRDRETKWPLLQCMDCPTRVYVAPQIWTHRDSLKEAFRRAFEDGCTL